MQYGHVEHINLASSGASILQLEAGSKPMMQHA